MNNVQDILSKITGKQLISSIIIIIISFIIYKAIGQILIKSEKSVNMKLFPGKRGKTYARLMRNILRYIFIIVTILILLKVNGIDVSSALAGVGIISVIFGLAIQDWLKDIIRGTSIISDNYFSVGDVVKYKDTEGKVLMIGLKSTKIEDLKTGNIKTIANRNIEEVDVVSNLVFVDVPMPYELPLDKAENVIDKITESIKENNNVNNCTYIGVHGLEASFINYYLKVECNQLYKLQVKRDSLRTVLDVMSKNGIEVPYTQIDIHNK